MNKLHVIIAIYNGNNAHMCDFAFLLAGSKKHKISRSQFSALHFLPTAACASAVRGRSNSTARYALQVKPEQSIPVRVVPPHL